MINFGLFWGTYSKEQSGLGPLWNDANRIRTSFTIEIVNTVGAKIRTYSDFRWLTLLDLVSLSIRDCHFKGPLKVHPPKFKNKFSVSCWGCLLMTPPAPNQDSPNDQVQPSPILLLPPNPSSITHHLCRHPANSITLVSYISTFII